MRVGVPFQHYPNTTLINVLGIGSATLSIEHNGSPLALY